MTELRVNNQYNGEGETFPRIFLSTKFFAMTLKNIKGKKPNVNPLLLFLLQGLENKNHQIEFENGSFSFTPTDGQWENLKGLGLINNRGFLTNLGKNFVYQSPAIAMSDELLVKTISLLTKSFNQRGLIISGNLYDEISNMVQNFNFANDQVETISTLEEVMEDKTEIGTEVEVKVESKPKRKSRPKVKKEVSKVS